jgi:UDP:flavonoid glycosyltransferase YjiC (YdhE family)
MRVLFTTWAWPSHFLPMVPLAWALRAAGHDVRMTSQPALIPAMLEAGLPVTPVGHDLDFAGVYLGAMEQLRAAVPTVPGGIAPARRRRFERVSDRVLAANGDRAVRDQVRALLTLRDLEGEAQGVYRAIRANRPADTTDGLSLYGEIAEAMVDGLVEFGRAWKPDLIVFDPLTYAGPIAASLLGVPAVRNLFGPDVTYFNNLGEAAVLGPLLARHGLDTVDLLGTATVDPCPPGLQFPDSMTPTRRIFHRYVPHNGMSEIPRWLYDEPERPRICLTWGTSMVKLFGEQAFLPPELLLGAIKLAEDRGAELMLAVTASQRNLLPDLPDVVRVVESVPLQALLPTCQLLIHQGGAGSMLSALVCGLPQLVVSQMPDQGVNAHLLVATGAGQTMAARGADAAAVLNAGHELLDEASYAAAGRRLRDEIFDQPTPAEIVPDLEALVA